MSRKKSVPSSSTRPREFEGLLRLRVGNHRVLFDETADTITIHRIRDRRDVYR